MTLLSVIPSLTPTLDDYVYATDADLGGSPTEQADGRTTFTAIRDLLQANLTTAVASTGYNISTDVKLARDAANSLALRNGTNAQQFGVFNTYTDASNYEGGYLRWAFNILEIATASAGTGTARGVRFSSARAGYDAFKFYTAGTGNPIAEIGASNGSNGQIRMLSGLYGFTFGALSTGAATVGITAAASGTVVKITNGNGTTVGGGLATLDAGALTIATGSITTTGTYHTVDTESAAASDDLDTIVAGTDGQFLILQAEDGARTVVAKDGTGNLQLAGDFSLDNAQDTLTLIYSAALTAWVEISRSDNGA